MVQVGNNALAVAMAEERAQALGFSTLVLSTTVEGEAREVAKVLAAIAQEVPLSARPLAPPCCIIIGGETTVTLTGSGKGPLSPLASSRQSFLLLWREFLEPELKCLRAGGRNQEIALAAARQIAGQKNMVILSAGTDGTDGPTDAAGGVCDGGTVARAEAKGVDSLAFLENNDAYNFFKQLGDGVAPILFC